MALALKKGAAAVHHYTSNGLLRIYDNRSSSLILDAALSGRPSVDLNFKSRGSLTIDLARMKEVNLNNGREEDIVIEICWDLKALVSNIFTSTKTARLQILSLIVEKLRHESNVKKFLKAKAGPDLKIISYRPNPFLSPECLLFTRFLESFEAAVQMNREGFEKLFDKIRFDQHIGSENQNEDMFIQEDDMVVMCFHGTNHEWMDNIMQNGMDPSRTGWFGIRASTSVRYTIQKTTSKALLCEGTKLLVFLVIMDVSSTEGDGIITNCSSPKQLPVGEVTIR